MIQLEGTTMPYGPAENQEGNRAKLDCAFSLRRREKGIMLKIPNGLVVSSDEEVRRSLAKMLVQCELAPLFSSTVAESRMVLSRRKVFIVLCHDLLVDGEYHDIVRMVNQSDTNVPVIVVSRTGDWPEYLTAIRAGVFDHLAYPPIAGELQRIIRNALSWNKQYQGAEVI